MDPTSKLKPVLLLAPKTYDFATNEFVSDTIDTTGIGEIIFYVSHGVVGAGGGAAFRVDHSDDNSSWSVLVGTGPLDFPVIDDTSVPGMYIMRVVRDGNVKQYLRLRLNVTVADLAAHAMAQIETEGTPVRTGGTSGRRLTYG